MTKSIQPTAGFHPSVASLLGDYRDEGEMSHADDWLAETAGTLTEALRSYGMKADLMGQRLTPNAALIHFKGNDHISVDRIEKKRDYLFTTWGLEVLAVRPGRGRISVMVKREARHVTQTGLLWQKRSFMASAPYYNTSFVIGEREDTGEILYLNLAHAHGGQPVSGPHTLIAGESGGGKGVLAANLIMDICATNAPSMARIHLIDPKGGVDYDWLAQLPHLEGPIVTDIGESAGRYEDILSEMERRYALFGPARARDLDAWNDKVGRGEVPANISAEETTVLPRIYVVHDELADWMIDDDYRKDTGTTLARLSAKGRAAGIHLILVTQRPDKKAIPGLIKANIANKICLRVSNKVNSNLIIDEAGAEELMGAGHMLAIIGGVPGGALFAQSSYLDPWDAQLLADAVAADCPPLEQTFTTNSPKLDLQNTPAFLPKGNYVVTTIDECSSSFHPEWKERDETLNDALFNVSDEEPIVYDLSEGRPFALVNIGPDSLGIETRTVSIGDKGVIVDAHVYRDDLVHLVILPVNDTTSESEFAFAPDADDYAYINLESDSQVILADGKLTIGSTVIDVAKPGCFKTGDGDIVDMAEPGIAEAYGYADADAEDRFDEHGMKVFELNDKMTPAIRASFEHWEFLTLYYARRPGETPLAMAA